MALTGKHILLGVTGSIAAYKAALLVRLLRKEGAEVQVLMTPDAARFISPLTLATLSGRSVEIGLFDREREADWTHHVHLGLWADLLVVAPATAQTLAKLAHGFCDSMLTATVLSARCPVLVCPAMDHDMYVHPATQRNLDTLRAFGYAIMEPETGELASGLIGQGRLPEPEYILENIRSMLSTVRDLDGKKVLVTAGPTREHIDPVRFLSNPSTGKMGYALAAEAARRGAEVVLVSGPTLLESPPGVTRISVTSAQEMYEAVIQHRDADIIIMAAAVADYTPVEHFKQKLKKGEGELVLRFRRTPDILASLGAQRRKGQLLVGFALETERSEEHALEKLQKKGADWIVLNKANEPGAGFGLHTNRVTLFSREGKRVELPRASKEVLARWIWEILLGKEIHTAPTYQE